MFNICDLDGSGTIEKNEMYQFAIKLLKLEGKDQQDLNDEHGDDHHDAMNVLNIQESKDDKT